MVILDSVPGFGAQILVDDELLEQCAEPDKSATPDTVTKYMRRALPHTMAVLDAHPGLRTEITVNKKSLTEYHNDNVDTSPTAVNKFIKARTGAEVKTILKNPLPRDNGVEITCSVDGHQAARWDIDPENPTWYAPTNMKGIITVGEESILQKFQFSKLAIGTYK